MTKSLHDLVHDCFQARKYPLFKVMTRYSRPDDLERCFIIAKTRHLIGRPGDPMKTAKFLVEGASIMPRILENFQIKICQSSCFIKSGLDPSKVDLDGIIGRMFSEASVIAHYRKNIALVDPFGDLLQRARTASSFSTRVHAELLLVAHFQSSKIKFLDGDKYIGCSKPACFCCYHYISAIA